MGWRRSIIRSIVFFCLALSPFSESLAFEASRETAYALESVRNPSVILRLGIKRFAREGAQPVLLVHGLGQNDRIWDSPIAQFSFARFLHSQGFDVWVGNLRGAGTQGYESDKPAGPARWTVEHYAAYDVPALVQAVLRGTGKRPFLVGHSMAAWAFSGYLSGLTESPDGVGTNPALARAHQSLVRGVASVSGIYNIWWSKSVTAALSDPIRGERDFYASNYELELAARSRPLVQAVARLPAVPLDWLERIIHLRVGEIPFIGTRLEILYRSLALRAIETPFFSMLYHSSNADPEAVRDHLADGMDDISPPLLEQLANGVRERELLAHYPGDRPRDAFSYAAANRGIERAVPLLFVAGAYDRLAHAEMVRRDGFEATRAADKSYVLAPEAGHLDILNGRTSARDVWAPIARWIQARL